ncbi:MAG: Lrp/AsnC family transcriptional regulator [Chloroflexota bacterium]|nr:AsnC family transcriptional regulator [Candidatus Sulfotelmatobacter sp.]
MKELKAIDYKLLFELMKDSHRSDRQIAKSLGVSQPTVTRRRGLLEKNYIEGYTIIPKFGQIGFEIAALTFVKSKAEAMGAGNKENALQRLRDWYTKQPNVVMVQEGQGMGWNLVCASLHQNYTDYAEFVRCQNSELCDLITESQTFVMDLKPGVRVKPFNFKYLATQKA